MFLDAYLMREPLGYRMQQDLTLHQIRLFFSKLAELGSISKVGSAMLVPQPEVSSLITRLERNIGSPPLERSGRGACLKPARERFKKRAELIVFHHDLAHQDVQETHAPRSGPVEPLCREVARQISANMNAFSKVARWT